MANLFFPDDNLFDSHCHLNDHSFDADRVEVVGRASAAGVSKIIDIAIDIECSRKAIAHAKEHTGVVFASVGIDPDVIIPSSELFQGNLDKPEAFWDEQMNEVRELIFANREQVVAVGETGMDKHWVIRNPDSKPTSEEVEKVMQRQEMLFRKHLELAVETKLPLTIHSRACEEDCLRIVLDYSQARGVFHSYTGSYETAKKVLDAGWSLGVNGIITFKSAQELRAMYKKILGAISSDAQPADFYAKGIYFETDAPYLSPEGKRGERNEPAAVVKVWEKFLIL